MSRQGKIWTSVTCLLLAFTIGLVTGDQFADQPAKAEPHPSLAKAAEENAYNYADWCGGYVQTFWNKDGSEGHTVLGCDR